ncbi:MAG: hypothetical protein HYV97_07925 [Bdellovibrio sp.]|nr:hypothetical protein [Bdellovibrio sp.]
MIRPRKSNCCLFLILCFNIILGNAQEPSQAELRAKAFDDTPVRGQTPEPTPAPGHKSFINEGLGKMEMLEEVDKHLASMTNTLNQLTGRITKIEETLKKIPQDIDQIKNTELPAIKKQLSTSIYAAPLGPNTAGTTGTGTGSGATLGKVLEGIGDGELKDMKSKVEEMHSTSVPNLQFEVSLLKDTLRTLEAIVTTMDPFKGKGPVGGVSIEQDKKKAP